MERLIVTDKKYVDIASIKHLLNGQFIKHIDLPERVLTFKIHNPKILILHPDRFDLINKYIYVKHKELNIDSNWSTQLYKNHIGAWTLGKFKEFDGSKNTFFDYKNNFDHLIEKIKKSGFDSEKSIIPINSDGVVLEGAHRVSICAYFDYPVTVACINHSVKYDFKYFIKKGLATSEMDTMAFEFCKNEDYSYLAILNSVALEHQAEADKILNTFGKVYYRKEINLSTKGYVDLVKIMYDGEDWLGSQENNFIGARRYTRYASIPNKPLTLYVLYAEDKSSMVEAKSEIRKLASIGNYAIHINDTHMETISMAKILLNSNSIHYLENGKENKYLSQFQHYFQTYSKTLLQKKLNKNYFCVSGSATLSAYGLRDARDLDFIHFKYKRNILGTAGNIQSHNKHLTENTDYKINDILFDPSNHFYYQGMKFIAVNTLKTIKKQRGEPKDLKDLKLINHISTESLFGGLKGKWINYFKHNYLKIELYLRRVKNQGYRKIKGLLIRIVK